LLFLEKNPTFGPAKKLLEEMGN